jgi:very-short-patch-repair endonuclease
LAGDSGPINERTRDRARKLRRDMTGPEKALWRLLRGSRLDGFKFRRQHPIGPFVADFCCVAQKLVVELDGMTHAGAGDDDDARTKAIEQMGYRVIRFTNDDVIDDPELIAETILRELGRPTQAKALSP